MLFEKSGKFAKFGDTQKFGISMLSRNNGTSETFWATEEFHPDKNKTFETFGATRKFRIFMSSKKNGAFGKKLGTDEF